MQTSQSWGNCKVTVEPAGVARSGMWLKRGSGEACHITLTQQDGEPPGQCWANRTGRRMNGSVNGLSQWDQCIKAVAIVSKMHFQIGSGHRNLMGAVSTDHHGGQQDAEEQGNA